MAISVNKQKEKGWKKIIREVAKELGWKYKSFFAYNTEGIWFYTIDFFMSPEDNRIFGSLRVKPIVVDNVFWEITSIQSNPKTVSLRGNGAFVFTAKAILTHETHVIADDLDINIRNVFAKAKEKLQLFHKDVHTLNDFIAFIEQNPDSCEWFDHDLVQAIYIAQKQYDKVLPLLEYVKTNRKSGGWTFSFKTENGIISKSYYDLAIEYCKKKTQEGELSETYI